jgi:hypothetical protein
MLLPNVSNFGIARSHEDEILKAIGINRKLSREIWSKELLKDHPANKYLTKMYEKLYKYAKEGEKEKYDKLAEILTRRSKAVLTLSLFRVYPTWYKSLIIFRVITIIREMRNIFKGNSTKIDFKRVWIPKPNSKEKRALSVPTISWRAFSNWKTLITWI